jgi:DNA-binding response OmpR family regulator
MSGKKLILVIDDDPALVNLLRENLEMEGYKVIFGLDGHLGLQAARRENPDLIVLDVAMPMLNGIKVFQYLRDTEGTRNIPVIFLSGELSKDVYPIVENSPRVAHLKKPADLEQLNGMVREFLRQYPVDRV